MAAGDSVLLGRQAAVVAGSAPEVADPQAGVAMAMVVAAGSAVVQVATTGMFQKKPLRFHFRDRLRPRRCQLRMEAPVVAGAPAYSRTVWAMAMGALLEAQTSRCQSCHWPNPR